MAKDIIERWFRIWFDDVGTTPRDLSGDLIAGTVTGGGLVFDDVDMHGVSEKVRNYLAGHAEAPISAQFHMNDTADTGAYTVLKGNSGGTGTLTLQFGTGAAPAGSDPEWEGEYVLLGCPISTVGGKMVITANWKPTGSTAPAWGTYS